MLPNKSLFPPFPTRPKISFYKIWPFFFGYCVQCKLSWQYFAILLLTDVLLPFWKCRWLPLTQYLYLVKFCAKDSGQRLFRGGGERVESALRIFITKFGNSQKSSLNLVKEFAQYFPLVLFLKQRFTKMVTIFVTKFCDSQNPSTNLVNKIALSQSIIVF